jgi:putative transposase
VSRRAQILLLLSSGRTWREVREIAFASFDLIRDAVTRWTCGGAAAVVELAERPTETPSWLGRVIEWLKKRTPRDFGYFRSRWSCATLAETLAWETGVRLSGETLRRVLHRIGWVWRRPRPIVGPTDPDYERKYRRVQTLLKKLKPDETAVFQDEVDVHLNPKIGSCWMPRGKQTEVVTPGNNDKRHVAGSLHWRTGRLLASPPSKRRNSDLFLAHLDDLRTRLRGFRRIHVVCDNAAFHRSRAVERYLAKWRDRLEIHFLPKYAPETNPIERVWWHFHETITRNHRCKDLDELLGQADEWFRNTRHAFYAEMKKAEATRRRCAEHPHHHYGRRGPRDALNLWRRNQHADT